MLDHIKGFLAVGCQVVLNLELLELRGNGERAEEVVVDHENLHVFIVDVCAIACCYFSNFLEDLRVRGLQQLLLSKEVVVPSE